MNISQAAKLIGVKAATLRQWDRDGKLKPARDADQNRVYTDHDIAKGKALFEANKAKTWRRYDERPAA